MGKFEVTVQGVGDGQKATVGSRTLTGVFGVELTDKYLAFHGFDYDHKVKSDQGVEMADYLHLRCFPI